MPWNEPGKPGKDDDNPWTGGGRRGGGKNPQSDLEAMAERLNARIRDMLGGAGGGGDEGGDGPPGHGRAVPAGIGLLLIIAILVWIASGFYIVREGERGVVLRFGEFEQVTLPGPNWHFPVPIEKVEIVDIDSVRSVQHRARMLTQDENIIEIDLTAQYRVSNAELYLFSVRDPDNSLRQIMESGIRERVGKSSMDFILGEGRGEIVAGTRSMMQAILDLYSAGLVVTTVNLQQAQPPEPVQNAFADAVRAREDEVRFRNEAEAYANTVIPRARGEAARLEQEAEAYRDQLVSRATGDASRFSQLLAEYEKAPQVTRERLYIETMEEVFGETGKVLVDMKQGSNLLYLPLDQMISGAGTQARKQAPPSAAAAQSGVQEAPRVTDPRARGVR